MRLQSEKYTQSLSCNVPFQDEFDADADECLIAIKLLMSFHIFLRLFKLFLKNRS